MLLQPLACTLGPDFQRPKLPEIKELTPPQTSAQTFVKNQEIPADWWTLFQSEKLKKLIAQAFVHSPNLEAAQAALLEAREKATAQEGALWPSLDAAASARRQMISGAMFGSPTGGSSLFSIYNGSINISYTIDVFGGIRRQIEGLEALAEYQRFQLEAAYLTLASNIALTAVQEASIAAQIEATRTLIKVQEQQLEIRKQQWQLGSELWSSVLGQESALIQTRIGLIPLNQQLDQLQRKLAVLVGQYPGEAPLETFSFADLQLPKQLPLSLPTRIVEQRPDVRAAEATVHAASAQIGVATAKMFPDLSLSASVGTIATQVDQMFMPGSQIWNVGMNLAQPIFKGGQAQHGRLATIAAFDQAAAKYRSTVLQAFQNVGDVLKALEADQQSLSAQEAALKVSQENLDLADAQLKAGSLSYLESLEVQRNFQQVTLELAKAKAQRFSDTVALYQALGGGWWNRKDQNNASN